MKIDEEKEQNKNDSHTKCQSSDNETNVKMDKNATCEKDEDEEDLAPVKPLDGGYGWVIVICSFVFQSMIDGTFSIFGVFLPHFLDYYGVGRGRISMVGSALTACFLMSGPFISILAQCIGCRAVGMMGGFFITAGFVLSTFTPSVEYLIITFGLITGIGLGMVYLPSIVVCGQYFEKKRALAMGIASSGAGIGMLILAPLSAILLDIFDWKNALVLVSGVSLQSVICGALLMPLESCRTKKDNAQSNFSTSERDVKCENNDIPNKVEMTASPTVQTIVTSPSPNHLRKVALLNSHNNAYTASNALYTSVSQDISHSLQNGFLKDSNEYVNDDLLENELHVSDENLPTIQEGKTYCSSFNSLGETCVPKKEYGHLRNNRMNKISHTCGNINEISKNCRNIQYSSCHDIGTTSHKSSFHNEPNHPSSAYKNKLLSNPFLRKDVFYSGSLLNLPEYKLKPCDTSYIASVTIENANQVEQISEESDTTCKCIKKEYLFTFKRMLDISVFANASFVVISLGNVFMQTGYFIPIMFLPDFALKLGMDAKYGATLMSIFGVFNTIGRLSAGALASVPRINSVHMCALSMVLSGIACACCVLCTEFISLAVCVACLGICVAPIIPLTNVFLVQYLGLDKLTSAVGLLSLQKGTACIFGPPLAGMLLDGTGTFIAPFAFAGALFVVSGLLHYLLLFNCITKQHK